MLKKTEQIPAVSTDEGAPAGTGLTRYGPSYPSTPHMTSCDTSLAFSTSLGCQLYLNKPAAKWDNQFEPCS